MNFRLWILSEHTQESKNAKDILHSVKLNDHKYKIYHSAKGNDKKLLELKYQEAKEDGLLEDVLKNGIKHPIEIIIDKNGNQTLIKGHHRLAIALKHFPTKLIKIKYTGSKDKSHTWHKPDFKEEKEELIRQADTLNIKHKDIFEAFNQGTLKNLKENIWEKLENTNSNDKNLNWNKTNSWKNKDVKGIKKALKENESLPAPIVLKFKNKYYCVAGNTRLSISKLLNITPKVWMIDV